MKANDYSGKRFGHLVALERVANTPQGCAVWKCRCDCGNITHVRSSNLQSGAVQTCGRSCKLRNRYKTHGMSKTRLYSEWNAIKARCSPKDKNYRYYNGRGISVCEEWINSFEAFAEWAFNNGYNDSLTIERIDFNGDYSPDNCTWIPKSQQSSNRRSCLYVTYKGQTKILKDWCVELGLDYKRTNNRLKKLGWTPERAFETPVISNRRNMETRKRLEGDENE